MGMKENWSVGAKIWLGFDLLCQWIVVFLYGSKYGGSMSSAAQSAMTISIVVAIIGSIPIIWLMVSHSKAAMYTLLLMGVLNAIVNLINSGMSVAIGSLVPVLINWLVVRRNVEASSQGFQPDENVSKACTEGTKKW